jgi:hypothetical protein
MSHCRLSFSLFLCSIKSLSVAINNNFLLFYPHNLFSNFCDRTLVFNPQKSLIMKHLYFITCKEYHLKLRINPSDGNENS